MGAATEGGGVPGRDAASRAATELAVERRRVAAIYREYDDAVARARARLAAARSAVTVEGDAAERAAAMHEREVAIGHWTRRLRRLLAAEDALVIGRLDRADGGVRYVGRVGLGERAESGPERGPERGPEPGPERGPERGPDGGPLLIDWRADAARPFYAATSREPMGLRRRRQLRLEGRRVIGVADEILDGSEPGPADIPGDPPLLQALAAARTGRLAAAVETLQAEQDAAVRAPVGGVTVVTGGPGTGKTLVALHRAAYVLYATPRLADEGVLVLGPDRRFLDYISQVLPSLGEDDAVLATPTELVGVEAGLGAAARPVGEADRPEGAGERPGGVGPGGVGERPVEPEARARAMGKVALAEGLARWLRDQWPAPGPGGIRFGLGDDEVRLPAAAVVAARDRALTVGLAHNPAQAVFAAAIVDDLVDALERRAEDLLGQFDADLAATGLDLDAAAAADLASLGFGAEPDRPEGLFDAEATRAELAGDRRVLAVIERLWPTPTPEDVVRGLLADDDALLRFVPELDADERAAVLARPLPARGVAWPDADLALLDEARALVAGPPARTFGHVVVDEAQEVTAMQWRAIRRRCPGGSVTVSGDFAQAGPLAGARTWREALAGVVGAEGMRVHPLTVNYRSTAEILDRTRDLLARIAPDHEPSTSVRHGEVPRDVRVPASRAGSALAAEIRREAELHPGGVLGVIAADGWGAGLAGESGVAGELGGVAALGAGAVELVPASRARGLEFDAVVVVAPDEIVAARSSGERDLYVALTRASSRLCVLHLDGG